MITKLYQHREQTKRYSKKAKETKQNNEIVDVFIQTPGKMLIGGKRRIAQLLEESLPPLWFTFLFRLVQVGEKFLEVPGLLLDLWSLLLGVLKGLYEMKQIKLDLATCRVLYYEFKPWLLLLEQVYLNMDKIAS